MADGTVDPITKAEAEIKTASGDEEIEASEGKREEGTEDLGRILEVGPPPLGPILKPYVEEFSRAAETLVQNEPESVSYVAKAEEEVEKLISDSWAAIKNETAQSSQKGTEETLPTSDENAAEPEKGGLEENPRNTHTEPFIAANAASASRASWMNCCGLLDVLRPSDH